MVLAPLYDMLRQYEFKEGGGGEGTHHGNSLSRLLKSGSNVVSSQSCSIYMLCARVLTRLWRDNRVSTRLTVATNLTKDER